jgi:hypothetical protein
LVRAGAGLISTMHFHTQSPYQERDAPRRAAGQSRRLLIHQKDDGRPDRRVLQLVEAHRVSEALAVVGMVRLNVGPAEAEQMMWEGVSFLFSNPKKEWRDALPWDLEAA